MVTYVKGYAFDWNKIMIFLSIDDDKDRLIDGVIIRVLEFINRDTTQICMATRCGEREERLIIMLTADAIHKNREKLEAMDLSPPRYLVKLAEPFLSGPEVFEFKSW